MKLITNVEQLYDELIQIVKLFECNEMLPDNNLTMKHMLTVADNKICSEAEVLSMTQLPVKVKLECNITKNITECKLRKIIKTYAKQSIYNALSQFNNKQLAWGSLTGIRPTKVFYDLLQEYSITEVKRILKDFYQVKPRKIKLLEQVVNMQRLQIGHFNEKNISLYVHIPFCTTKCSYCTFITTPLSNTACINLVNEYVTNLIKEIKLTKEFLIKNGYTVNSVYIGGGTPTALTANMLEKILQELNIPVNEFTVEAGRPDTITKEKLDVLQKYNVTRISINPQTFNNKTLQAIGRSHSVEDILSVYELAKNYNFIINMDLIAGLNGESFNDFQYSLNKTLELNPHNITVHTLTIKRGSHLEREGGKISHEEDVVNMINYSHKTLTKHNYMPYYLYKQKYMVGNLENVGYCKDKLISNFNIYSMEEVTSVIACGSGGISKRVCHDTNVITRSQTTKNVAEYNQKIDDIISKKLEFFR